MKDTSSTIGTRPSSQSPELRPGGVSTEFLSPDPNARRSGPSPALKRWRRRRAFQKAVRVGCVIGSVVVVGVMSVVWWRSLSPGTIHRIKSPSLEILKNLGA